MPAADRKEVPIPGGERKAEFLAEATRIGDELLDSADVGPSGMSWKSLDLGPDGSVSWRTSESLYSGGAGIALFFLELHRQTGRSKYLEAAVEGMRWVTSFCDENPSGRYALFTGRMGPSFAALRMYHHTRDTRYVEWAVKNARPCAEFLREKHRVNDLLNGTAGALLGLLHLHAETGELWILDQVEQFVETLVREVHLGPTGVYWDRSGNQIRGLCGLSHGAAGVGLALLETGNYLRLESLCWLAEEAFRYEDQFFDPARNNWPDFRIGTDRIEDEEKSRSAYLKGELAFFTEPGDMNAWCHGAAGIGLTRLRAWEILGDPKYRSSADRAVAKTRQTELESPSREPRFPLCHGGFGNAELFLTAYRLTKEGRYRLLAEEVAGRALKSRQDGPYRSGLFPMSSLEDTSLYMGNAGIGYFYLEVADPESTQSPLVPFLGDPALSHRPRRVSPNRIPVSAPQARRSTLRALFPRSLVIAERLRPRKLHAFWRRLKPDASADPRRLLRLLGEIGETLPEPAKACLAEAVDLEKTKSEIGEAFPSNAWLKARLRHQIEGSRKLAALADAALREAPLLTDPQVMLVVCAWNWSLLLEERWAANLFVERSEYPLLLRPLAEGVEELDLSPLAYALLEAFQEPRLVGSVIADILRRLEPISEVEQQRAEESILSQLREALASGLLAKPADEIEGLSGG